MEGILKIKCKDCDCCLEYQSVEDVINKFILLLRKCVYSYEYMDDWKKFMETTLPEKGCFS